MCVKRAVMLKYQRVGLLYTVHLRRHTVHIVYPPEYSASAAYCTVQVYFTSELCQHLSLLICIVNAFFGFSTGPKVWSVPRYHCLQRGLFHQAVLHTFCAYGAGWSAQKLFLHRGREWRFKEFFFGTGFSWRAKEKVGDPVKQLTYYSSHHKAWSTETEVALHSKETMLTLLNFKYC